MFELINKGGIRRLTAAGIVAITSLLAVPASAQTEGPDPLRIFFPTGSSDISGEGQTTLDEAARLFREGNPIVMIVAGGTDTVGPAELNLQLSLNRAEAVAGGLAARGIPVDRLQVHGRGASELAVETGDDVANRENRVVEISWR